MSTVTQFGLRPERTPVFSKTIDRTSSGRPTIVKTTSQERASSSGELARQAPWDWRERDLEGLRA